MSQLGIIGLGNMGGAILSSILKNEPSLFDSYNIYDIDDEKLKRFEENENVHIKSTLQKLCDDSKFILLAVKPQYMNDVLQEIKNEDLKGKELITIAAGLEKKFYMEILGKKIGITRIMPNTPLLISEGASGISFRTDIKEKEKDTIYQIFNLAGEVIICDEKYLDVVTGLSGSGPAYIFMIIEALADGAVKMGLPRQDAYKLAAQTVVGAGKMVLETKKHPGELKDMVTSPGGTTIEALSVLERGNLRSTLIDAVVASTKKSQSFHQ